ncbi:hydrogenase maturation nickel metallochaperone HypA [bacterium]|nr:hydrogenase maturation nickel metallochaperone HypA [bacterium]
MKRIFVLFTMLFSINLFACDGVVHETLEEAKALHEQGYKLDARALMDELFVSNGFVFSEAEWECIAMSAPKVNRGPVLYKCNNCGRRFWHMGSSVCPACGSRDTQYAAW